MHVQLVTLDGNAEVEGDVDAIPVVLVGELKLPEDEERGNEMEDCMVVETSEVPVGPADVVLIEVGTEVLDNIESDELVRKELDKPVVNVTEEFVEMELDRLVDIAELPVMVTDAFKDMENVTAGCPEVALLIVGGEDGVAVPVPVGTREGRVPVLFGPVAVTPLDVEFMKGCEQHEDENGAPPLGITVRTRLVEMVTSVGAPLLPVPSSIELDGGANVREDRVTGPVSDRLVAFVPTDREPVPDAVGPRILVTDEELLKWKERLYGGRAENEEMEKPRNVVEIVAVALPPDKVAAPDIVSAALVPGEVVAALPPVALATLKLSEVPLTEAVEFGASGGNVVLLAMRDSVVDGAVAKDEDTSGADGFIEGSEVEFGKVNVSIGPPVVMFAAEDEGDINDIVPLGNGWDRLEVDIAVEEVGMKLELIHE